MYSHRRIRRIRMHLLLLLWSLEVGFKQLQSLREITDVLREISDVRYPLEEICDSPIRKLSRQMSAYMLKIYVHSRTAADIRFFFF